MSSKIVNIAVSEPASEGVNRLQRHVRTTSHPFRRAECVRVREGM